jgi:hypothetical protein
LSPKEEIITYEREQTSAFKIWEVTIFGKIIKNYVIHKEAVSRLM